MILDGEACYHALKTHDARFDGAFFVGVASTGIYCRPICTARLPKRENCGFYPSAAAAEAAGFRPCLRCRPEMAPGNAKADAAGRLAALAAARIEGGALADADMATLAAGMGVSDRHLRRVMQSEYGVSPIELAQTQRLLLAKQLLTDTNLSVTEVALASGFASLRRFNALFQERYRLTPTALRRQRKMPPEHAPTESVMCEIGFRPPFDFDFFLDFLRGRTVRGVEEVTENCYRRTLTVGGYTGWISVSLSATRPALRVETSGSLLPVLGAVLGRVKRVFDVAADPAQITERLGSLAAAHPGLRVPGAFDGFEASLRAILGQQISVKAAATLAGRFAAAFGEPLETPFPNLTHCTPTAGRLAQATPEEIIALGVVSARARTIIALAQAVSEKRISLEPTADPESVIALLQELPGIGPWTAHYIALRALSWPDAFPHTDLGVMKALNEKNPKRILEIAEAWRPWRGYAVMHLWKSLG